MTKEFDSHGFELLLQYLLSEEPGMDGAELDQGGNRERALERYQLLWNKIDYFLERRGCCDHEDGAEETILRVTSLLPREQARVRSMQAFCLGVARLVGYEYLRRQGKVEQLSEGVLDHPPASLVSYPDDEDRARSDRMLESMSECFNRLSLEDQELIRRYEMSGRGQRQKLADELGISLKALQERRIFSIRKYLRRCLNDCLGRCREEAKRPRGWRYQ